MTTEDLATVLAGGFAQLSAAQAAAAPPAAGPTRGKDREGLVEVVVDERGILTGISFADEIADLTAAELESAVLEATRDAYDATGRPRVRTLPGLGDSEVAAGVRRALRGEGGR